MRTGQTPHSIEVQIERIVLHGYPDGLRREIGPLVEQRLAQLAGATPGATPGGSRDDSAHFTGGPLPQTTASRIADGIAEQVWTRIRPHSEGTNHHG